MFEIFLISEKPISIIFNGAKIEVSNAKRKKLQFEDAKKLNLDFYFSKNSSQIFHAECNFDEGYKTDCEFLKIVKLSEQKYIFNFLIKNECYLQKKCKKIVKSSQIFNFYQNGLVEIETENELKFSKKYDFEILDADVLEMKNNYFALKLFGKEELEKSIIFNNFFAEILTFDSCILENTNTGFKVLTNLFDIACHGLVETFEIDEDIKKVDEYCVYMFESARNEFNMHVLPIYFLECIRAKDFKEASNCLSLELKNKAKPEHLAQYFGDFVDIYSIENKIYLEYVDSFDNHFAKPFTFNIQNQKISSIS